MRCLYTQYCDRTSLKYGNQTVPDACGRCMFRAAASASACRAYHTTLDVPTVFYCLALFQLPRTSMVIAFTMAVQGLTELVVSIRRIDEFLCTPEPPQRKVRR